MLECPRNSCTLLKSAPLLRRCVANEWRNVWGEIFRPIATFAIYLYTIFRRPRSVNVLFLAFKNKDLLLSTRLSKYFFKLTIAGSPKGSNRSFLPLPKFFISCFTFVVRVLCSHMELWIDVHNRHQTVHVDHDRTGIFNRCRHCLLSAYCV